MAISRRKFLRNSALAAGAVAAPHVWIPASREAWGASIKKGEPIKVGLLFSLTGSLAVPEEDSTLVMQYAIEEINDNGGIDGSPIEPIIIDAKSDFKVYTEKARELILRDKVLAIFGCYTSGQPQGDPADRHAAGKPAFLPDLLRGRRVHPEHRVHGPAGEPALERPHSLHGQ